MLFGIWTGPLLCLKCATEFLIFLIWNFHVERSHWPATLKPLSQSLFPGVARNWFSVVQGVFVTPCHPMATGLSACQLLCGSIVFMEAHSGEIVHVMLMCSFIFDGSWLVNCTAEFTQSSNPRSPCARIRIQVDLVSYLSHMASKDIGVK